ncbi:MAG: single-stranded DNA-binding protein [Candidatus Paceibacterota bacterium]|jgi:single-strand DNA-binding protein
MYLNKVYIIGNLTRDPEIKVLPSGTKVCSFAVATSRVYKDKEGVKQEMVEYHNVSAFAKLGELAGQYLKKGQQVLVEGRIQTRSWESNGEKKYRTEIIADNIQFGMKSSGTSSSKSSRTAPIGESVKSDEPSTASGSDIPTDKIDYPQDEINPDDIPF